MSTQKQFELLAVHCQWCFFVVSLPLLPSLALFVYVYIYVCIKREDFILTGVTLHLAILLISPQVCTLKDGGHFLIFLIFLNFRNEVVFSITTE